MVKQGAKPATKNLRIAELELRLSQDSLFTNINVAPVYDTLSFERNVYLRSLSIVYRKCRLEVISNTLSNIQITYAVVQLSHTKAVDTRLWWAKKTA